MELLPFSFKEYLRFEKITVNINRLSTSKLLQLKVSFDKYFKDGGFPMVIKEDDTGILTDYFKDIFYRDIIARYRLSHVDELKQIGTYFLSNISKKISYSTLQKIASVKSLSSIKRYLNYFAHSYLFFYINKFDFSLRKQMLNPRKVFTVDQGFIHKIGFNFSENKGRILENIVFIELKRRGKEIFYYSGKGECDFVIKQGLHITEAIQVTYILNNETIGREIKGLLEAMKEFHLASGVLLYYDIEIEESDIPNEIELVPVWKWLLR